MTKISSFVLGLIATLLFAMPAWAVDVTMGADGMLMFSPSEELVISFTTNDGWSLIIDIIVSLPADVLVSPWFKDPSLTYTSANTGFTMSFASVKNIFLNFVP